MYLRQKQVFYKTVGSFIHFLVLARAWVRSSALRSLCVFLGAQVSLWHVWARKGVG